MRIEKSKFVTMDKVGDMVDGVKGPMPFQGVSTPSFNIILLM
jgi:hypothetical protein